MYFGSSFILKHYTTFRWEMQQFCLKNAIVLKKIQYFEKPMSVYRASTPQSYMKKTLEDKLFYNEYTLEMIQFFEKFNLYTEKKFNSILEVKIMSDY